MRPPTDHDLHTDLVRAQLFDERTILLSGALDDETAARVAAELMMLDASGDEPVALIVNSLGGSIDAALAVMDVIELMGVPVRATCVGQANGPAVGIVAVADHRAAVPHARLRLAVGSSAFEGRASDVVAWTDAWRRRVHAFCERLSAAMRRPTAWVERALQEGRSLDAHEALRYGLIDEITRSHDATHTSEQRAPLGFRPPTLS